MNQKNFYRALHHTATQAGLKIITDDFCCQLLAWLLCLGGGIEDTVLGSRLNADLNEAQQRLNLYGGERADALLIPLLKDYKSELDCYLSGLTPKPEWVKQIENQYNLRPYRDSITIG